MRYGTMKNLCIAALLSAALAAGAQARQQIRIVGSSTVYPFSTAVAEQFGKSTPFKTPVVESTGSGGGLKLFCGGIGENYPDITNASRRIKRSEVDLCAENGVTDIVEVRIGSDGIVLGNAKAGPQLGLSMEQLFRALAKQVPVDGELVANPYRTWADIDASLPDVRIAVLGPPPTSGTRDAFLEIAMEGGARQMPALAALREADAAKFKAVTHGLREDGAFIEAGENDNLIVQKLLANPNAFGIFGFSFLDQNADIMQGVSIDGVAPTFENIADGAYPISRSMFFYLKRAHVGSVPGILDYAAEFVSEAAAGEDGYLIDKGLIPLSPELRARGARAEQPQFCQACGCCQNVGRE